MEKQIISEYKNGKSSIEIVKIVGLSKPTILKVLNKHNLIRKRDRCLSLNIKKDGNKYYVLRKCPMCKNDVKTSSKDKTIACRNHFNKINNNSLCRICMGKNNTGEGNPFYGKKHSKKTKKQISKNRKGKAIGENNSMAKLENREKLKEILLKRIEINPINFNNRSKSEIEIFEKIKKQFTNTKHSKVLRPYICDIFIPELNLIIEYNGDYWHCNPNKYNFDYYHELKKMFAEEIWNYDKKKIDLIKSNGYNLEVIWETEYNKNPKLINKIIKKYVKKN